MPTTRANFRTRVKYRLGNRPDATNARLDEWLNEGLHQLASRVRVRQLEVRDNTTVFFVVGTNEVGFPSNMIAISSIRNTVTNLPLEYMDWPRFRQLRIISGTPRQWSVFGTMVHFDKIPVAPNLLDVTGVNQPVWGPGDSDTPGVDDQLEYGIMLMAAAVGFRDVGDEEKAALIENPGQPGTGQFWIWVRANRIPTLLQGMADRGRFSAGVQVAMQGYDPVGG